MGHYFYTNQKSPKMLYQHLGHPICFSKIRLTNDTRIRNFAVLSKSVWSCDTGCQWFSVMDCNAGRGVPLRRGSRAPHPPIPLGDAPACVQPEPPCSASSTDQLGLYVSGHLSSTKCSYYARMVRPELKNTM